MTLIYTCPAKFRMSSAIPGSLGRKFCALGELTVENFDLSCLFFCLKFISFTSCHPKHLIFLFVCTSKFTFSYTDNQSWMYSKYRTVPKECKNVLRTKNETFNSLWRIFWLNADKVCNKVQGSFKCASWALKIKFRYNHTACLIAKLYFTNKQFPFLVRHEFQFKWSFYILHINNYEIQLRNRRLPALKATQYLIFNMQYIAYLKKEHTPLAHM